MTNTHLFSSFILAAVLNSAPAAKADTIENLFFAGTATCETGFGTNQECSSGGSVTGAYNLDVDNQTIVGAWLFTTPYGVFSSSSPGSSAEVFPRTQGGFSDDEVDFSLIPNAVLTLAFAVPNADELGPVVPLAAGLGYASAICQNVGGGGGCVPDVSLSGITTTASSVPEPSYFLLLSIGLGIATLVRLTTVQPPGRRS
jgi:hypothetical protein